MRLDLFVYEKGLAPSRAKAQKLIADGEVYLDGKTVLKPSLDVSENADVKVIRLSEDFVGRGAFKLLGAFEAFDISPMGKKCIDIGASTGGFTDLMLSRGALSVTAVDCGHGQLAKKLQEDPRVKNIEGYNARYIKKEDVGEGYELLTMDLSFISQTYVLPALPDIMADGGVLLSLIKPQFELDAQSVSKGVVSQPKQRLRALMRVYDFLPVCGMYLAGLINSPIKGGDGNREYFALIKKGEGRSVPMSLLEELSK